MAQKPWWQRISLRQSELPNPGRPEAAAGLFLAYASPVFITVALVPLFDVDILVGLAVEALAVASWVIGHWLVGGWLVDDPLMGDKARRDSPGR